MEYLFEITDIRGFSIRLMLAIALGLIIGLERQWTRHQAGIMTNVIVCVGAYAYCSFAYFADGPTVDVTRVAAQIVCGIGFLGAGLILRDGANIKGLATAATIWATASVGILCTLKNVLYSIIVAISIVFIHLVLHPVSDFINKKNNYSKERDKNSESLYKISIICNDSVEIDIRAHLIKTIHEKENILLHNLESTSTDNGNIKIRAYASTPNKNNEIIESVLAHIGKDEGLVSASWTITD